MSKSMLQAFITGQYNSLGAKDNKERLRLTIAGIKDGCFYDYSGTNYGVFDKECEDAEFFPESDLKLGRITGAKIAGITLKMTTWFDEYNGEGDEDGDTKDEAGEGSEKPKKDKVFKKQPSDTEAVEKACKKAIKKGDFKKAQKLIDKLGGHKKLQKKLDKAQ